MNKMKIGFLMSALIAVIALGGLLSKVEAKGDEVICNGSHTGSSFGSLLILEDTTCTLERFNVVNGDIKVKEGATLIICPDNDILGNIRANKPNTVFISDQSISPCSPPKSLGITIQGDIEVKNGGTFRLIGNPYSGVAIIEGRVKVKGMQTVEIRDFRTLSKIQGDVRVTNNADVTITGNTIEGKLDIKGTSGSCTESGNTVTGTVNGCP